MTLATHFWPCIKFIIFCRTIDCEQSLVFFRFSESNARARERRSRETRETRAAAREEKRETARLARANELSVGLTTQNTIGWFVKRWQQTVSNRNHWQVDDGWSTAGKFVTFPENKIVSKEKHKKVSSLRVRDVIAQFKCSQPLFTVKERFSSKMVVLL